MKSSMTDGSALAALLLIQALAVPLAEATDLSLAQVTHALVKATPDHPAEFAYRDLIDLDLSGLNFNHANLHGANLYGADLTDADFSGSDLSGATLDHTTIIRTKFVGAKLTHVNLFLPAAFSTLEASPTEAPSFVGADLSGARILGHLGRSDWHGALLVNAHLEPAVTRLTTTAWTDLTACNFAGADLSGADLTNAHLAFSNLRAAKFVGARLAGADLSHADLEGAELAGADFSGADLDETVLRHVSGLDTVKGLDTAHNLDRAVR